MSGKVCLDRVGGPVHISVHRTTVNGPTSEWPLLQPDEKPSTNRESSSSYVTTPCPNRFVIKETFARDIVRDVYHTSTEDNEVSLSQEDRRFLDTMDRTAHKNTQGNWEMPLPFRSNETSMPNNRSQAVHRLNGLLRSFKAKPQLELHGKNP